MGFCTVINCMDGRVQLPIIRYMQQRFEAEYVDSITEPGPVRIFDKVADLVILNSIFTRINISVEKHGSKVIAVCAHADCTANPVDDDTQYQQLRRALVFLKESYPDVRVIGLWVDLTGTVSEVAA